MVVCKVLLLDGNDFNFQVAKTAVGSDIFKKVCQKLELQHTDYFACTYKDPKGVKFWLSNEKKVGKQIDNGPWEFCFEVKFYPPDPGAMKDELTRYQLFLQLRTDVLCGKLPCSFVTLALLGSYAVQSQIGDYEPAEHGTGIQYLKRISFAPNQSEELLEKIHELHRTHRGQAPSEAEMHYLENAKNLSLYGVHISYAKEENGSDVQIGVCAAGLLIYKDRLRINRFTWPKILKIAYKRNIFTIRIRPGEFEDTVTTHEYKLLNYTMGKRLWKLAVEHHSFFRLRATEAPPTGIFGRFGPRYRMPARTHYEIQNGAGGGPKAGPPQRIIRAAPRQFVQSLENITGGNTTDRKEQFETDRSVTATLDLRGRRQNSVPMLDKWADTNTQGGAGPYGYGTGVTYASGTDGAEYEMGGGPYHTNSSGTHSVAGSRGMAPEHIYDNEHNRPLNEYDNHSREYLLHGDNDGSSSSQYGTAKDHAQINPYATYQGSASPNYNGDGMHPSQYDRQFGERSGYGAGSHDGDWSESGGYGAAGGTVGKTTTRTYTDEDGNIVTEYRTERHGVIETRLEKRRQTGGSVYHDDFDYDKALADAILAVTNVNTDLSVEKIEIQTTERGTMDDDDVIESSETLILAQYTKCGHH